jgi:hypothetical protein
MDIATRALAYLSWIVLIGMVQMCLSQKKKMMWLKEQYFGKLYERSLILALMLKIAYLG